MKTKIKKGRTYYKYYLNVARGMESRLGSRDDVRYVYAKDASSAMTQIRKKFGANVSIRNLEYGGQEWEQIIE